MSRVGSKTIQISQGVEVKLNGQEVNVKGPKGEAIFTVSPKVKVKVSDGFIDLAAKKEIKEDREIHGLTRTIIANMITGVSEGFSKRLEFHGVGYRAGMEGRDLVMHLGFSHPVRYTPVEGIEISVEKNVITVNGTDKQRVGQVAAEIRELKKPEPYKAKGIRYEGEHIRRKAGKTAAKGA
jgi:large subunit ribosomal protein L6